MARFVISCSNCGNPVEAKTGLLARRKIECSCGNTIDVQADKLASEQCPHCGNTFVYDQSKRNAECPICHTKASEDGDRQRLVEFGCAQCGLRLSTVKGAAKYVCPLCDFENDVQERLAVEGLGKQSLSSVIKYEGDNSAFVWKSPIEDFRYGSQLIVHESQEAIFFKDGQALDLFGPGRYTLETQQLPLLDKVYKLPTGYEGTFHTQVYFINKAIQMAIKWGTPDKVRFIDPLTGAPLQIGASGTMNLQVLDSRKLIVKLVGTMKGISWEDQEGFAKSLNESFRPLINNAVKTNLSDVLAAESIDILQIDAYLDLISQNLREKVIPNFEEYGLTIPEFYVTHVVLPEDDPNFQRIRELHTVELQQQWYRADADVKTVKAQSEKQYRSAEEDAQAAIEIARRKNVLQHQTTQTEVVKREAERTVIAAEAEANAVRATGIAEADVMRAKGYNERDVLQADVQKAYAAGIGNMGSGASGSNGDGGGITGDMLGMGVGLAMAGALAPQVQSMMQGMMPQQGAAQNSLQNAGWICACGQAGNLGNFCANCGSKKLDLTGEGTWNCSCGQLGNTGNYCSNCGSKRGDEE